MSDVAIRVENIGKRYRLGRAPAYRTLRESLVNVATSPRRWLAERSRARGPNGSTAGGGSKPAFWALRGVSFEAKHGEVIGIIGRNGAGKSTLLKILSQITEPTEGRAEIYGRVGSLLEVGTGFHPELTGRENLYMNGAILGMRKAEISRKFDEMVAFAEVEQFIDTPVKHYSSGMYMRLAFAVAAHLEPEILIVDEVLAVGDVQFQKKCLGKMGEVASHGRTVLFVSHNMGAVSRLCSRGIHLSDGGVKLDGPVEEAVSSYVRQLPGAKSVLKGEDVSVVITFTDTDGNALTQWRCGGEMVARVDVTFHRPVSEPAVDLAFYSDAGTKVFAVQSDKLPAALIDGAFAAARGAGPEVSPPTAGANGNGTVTGAAGGRFRFEFSVTNVGLAVNELAVDVGVRVERESKYLSWWQRVETLPVSLTDLPYPSPADGVIAPPVRLRVTSLA